MRGDEEDKPKGMHCMGPLKPATEMSGTALHQQSLLEKKTLFPVLCLLVGDSNPANACKVLWLLVVTYSDMHSGGERHLAADQLIERLPAIANSNVMENGVFGVPIDMAGRESVAIDGTALQTAPNSLVQFGSFDLNNQNEALARYTMLSAVQEPISDLQADVPTVNRGSVIRSDTLVTSVGRSVFRDIPPGSLHSIANFELQEQLPGGPPITATALAMLLARRSGFQENLNNLPISGPSIPPLGTSRTYVGSDCSNALNSSFGPTLDDGCDERFDNLNGKADFDRLPVPVELCEKVPVRAGYQLCTSMQNPESNAWMLSNFMNLGTDNPFGSCKFSNELSLSLTTSEPSVINGTNISDQCSEISGSGAMGHCLKETRLDLKRTSCNSKELSLSCGCYKVAPFSQVISGSKYLNVIQEILAQIASYSLDNLDQMNFSASGTKTGANTSVSRTTDGEMQHMQDIACAASANVDGRFEVSMDPALQKRALQAKRAQLLTLLQLVDERYNQCLDEIHTVISAFHAATELDPHLHTRFALQTVSVLYKGLRERISNQILAMGTQFDNGCTKEIEGSFETAYLQKQWTIQQLKKKDQQLWRPQRGLPERSVAVLRAWMFQNFLHPYPKDAEKHLLAVKSGLTRSQVSNWFINARVRLWKPMIEEMYAEMNKRKASQNEEGTNCYRRNQFGINSTRFNVNPI